MFGPKAFLSLIAVVLTIVGYVPYIRSVIQKQTKPHLFSWFVWTLDGFIIFALQITHGAGPGAFIAFTAGILSVTVLLLTFFNKGERDIAFMDVIFTILALIALVLWLIAKQPLLSAILIMTVDVFGFVPTVRKSWYKPHTENVTFYAINTVRFGFAFMALQDYSIVTTLYPSVWFVGNALFTLMLIIRRRES